VLAAQKGPQFVGVQVLQKLNRHLLGLLPELWAVLQLQQFEKLAKIPLGLGEFLERGSDGFQSRQPLECLVGGLGVIPEVGLCGGVFELGYLGFDLRQVKDAP
jgi:hypothetical protein